MLNKYWRKKLFIGTISIYSPSFFVFSPLSLFTNTALAKHHSGVYVRLSPYAHFCGFILPNFSTALKNVPFLSGRALVLVLTLILALESSPEK